VLVPALMPALAASAADWFLPPCAQWVALLLVTLGVLHCWEVSFKVIQPKVGDFDTEGVDFRSLFLRNFLLKSIAMPRSLGYLKPVIAC